MQRGSGRAKGFENFIFYFKWCHLIDIAGGQYRAGPETSNDFHVGEALMVIDAKVVFAIGSIENVFQNGFSIVIHGNS